MVLCFEMLACFDWLIHRSPEWPEDSNCPLCGNSFKTHISHPQMMIPTLQYLQFDAERTSSHTDEVRSELTWLGNTLLQLQFQFFFFQYISLFILVYWYFCIFGVNNFSIFLKGLARSARSVSHHSTPRCLSSSATPTKDGTARRLGGHS